MTDLSRRLRELRAEKGWSMSELATRASISKTHIFEMEAHRSINPSLKCILMLCKVFQVSPNYLLGFEGDSIESERRDSLWRAFQALSPKSQDAVEQVVYAFLEHEE